MIFKNELDALEQIADILVQITKQNEVLVDNSKFMKARLNMLTSTGNSLSTHHSPVGETLHTYKSSIV